MARCLVLGAVLLPTVLADIFCSFSWSGAYCEERSPIITVLIWVGLVLLVALAVGAVISCCCCCCNAVCKDPPPPTTVVTTMVPYQGQVPIGGMANHIYQPVPTYLPPAQFSPGQYPHPGPYTQAYASQANPQPPPYQDQDNLTQPGKPVANPQLYPGKSPDTAYM
ncbi:protein shisa-5-like [Callorhinchus milii]|uniref:protein shisa-5-like n=1 Tax=Callorhinchus milii TaxID=7868 RepID=UPI0004575BA2|nr:protein shisa-5-like [Callorhinchus milii]XP_007907086.1 protein shisa-5-like [Callorhinchus milii]|eukprot:gi/632980530/ref/XP_007907085.1/ PREDICTED: uncharacterized protein LOC103188787 [Callorhinchus milii]